MNNIQVTGVGTAYWAKINNAEDVYEDNDPKYVINIELPKAEHEKIIAKAKAAYEAYRISPEGKAKPAAGKGQRGSFGEVEDKNGAIHLRFWTYSHYPAKDGEEPQKKYLPILELRDGKAFPMEKTKNIGNGSKVQIAYTISPFARSKSAFGVSLLLNKVLVHELVEFGGDDMDASVFGVENGEEQSTFGVPESSDENAFD